VTIKVPLQIKFRHLIFPDMAARGWPAGKKRGARPARAVPGLPETTLAMRNARIAAKLTQDDLAAALGCTPQFVSDIENGRRPLPERYYEKLPPPIRKVVIKAAMADLAHAKEMLSDKQLRLRRIV
jgi:DNA-binding XRE family transcriptional regulator